MKIIRCDECSTMLNWTHDQLLGSSSSFLSPLYLHGRQRSKVYVQIRVNALMLYSWPSARQCAWTGITPCSQLLIWILKLAEAESESWVSFYAALWRTIMKESDFFFFNEKQISKIDSMVCLACVFWTRMCQCQMSVFYSGCKSCSVRPWPHFKIAVSLVSSWSNRPSHSNINKMWLLFSKPAPLKFLTPTPKWMAIGCFCSVVVKSPVNWEKNVTNI